MRKLNLFLVLVIPTISFFAVGGNEKTENFAQSADISQQINRSREENSNFAAPLALPEVFSETFTSTSSGYITNIRCGEEIPLTARLALVRFLNDNNKIYELNIDSSWPLASITKLMTAVVASERMGADKFVALTEEILAVEGESGNFKAGEIFKAGDLIKAMLMLSSNDAAEALARDFSYENFMGFMDDKAKELNMNSTRFFDPSGLSVRNQSTPNDIFKLVNYIYENHPDILKITSSKGDSMTEQKTKKTRKIYSNNEFAGNANFIGGKTGFIDESQGNLVSVFNYKKEPVVIMVLGSGDRFEETKKFMQCLENPYEININDINFELF